jgi:hypothetical protein
MSVEVIGKLCQVVIDVVAEMSFISLMAEPGGEMLEGRQRLAAEIPVHLPFSGRFRLTVQSSLLQEITCNIYGATDPPDIASQKDTLCELLNTIAGRMLRLLAPSAAGYGLGLPTPIAENDETDNRPGVPGRESGLKLVFYAREGCLVFSFIGSEFINEVMK